MLIDIGQTLHAHSSALPDWLDIDLPAAARTLLTTPLPEPPTP
ncbi:hypothetical protein [Nocardia brasiliensis]|nr:hypothetical protein [Nocardia brasiliensis]